MLQIEYVLGRTKLLLIFRCFVQGKDRCGSKTEKLGDERFGSAFTFSSEAVLGSDFVLLSKHFPICLVL